MHDTEALALVVPLNRAADEALRSRANRFIIHKASCYGIAKPPQASKRRQTVLFKLDLASLAGRRYISFGTARATEIRLPQSDITIQRQHFYLKIDLQGGSVLLTDVSTSGIQYAAAGEKYRHINKASIRISNDTRVRVGSNNGGMEFLIQPTHMLRRMSSLCYGERAHATSLEPGVRQHSKDCQPQPYQHFTTPITRQEGSDWLELAGRAAMCEEVKQSEVHIESSVKA